MSYIGSTPTTQNFIAGTDSFNGNGSATNFTLSRFVNSTNDIQVVVNNVVQYPPNYSVSGNTLTISPAPSSGTNNVYVRYLSTTLQSITVPGGSTVVGGFNVTGNVGIGTGLPTTNLNVYNSTNTGIVADGDSAVQIRAARFSSDGSSANFILRKARGSFASPSAVSSGDSTGVLLFQAYGGTNYRPAADIFSFVETYTSDTNISGGLAFRTNAGGTAVTEQVRITSGGEFRFNSGYGSVATAYGCRAWVNFNGTGTVAIRASGNVTSITDNNTGDYTVNFTNAMPDANYNAVSMGQRNDFNNGDMNVSIFGNNYGTAISTGSIRVNTAHASSFTLSDALTVCVSIFR
jgi:hypothetical protein